VSEAPVIFASGSPPAVMRACSSILRFSSGVGSEYCIGSYLRNTGAELVSQRRSIHHNIFDSSLLFGFLPSCDGVPAAGPLLPTAFERCLVRVGMAVMSVWKNVSLPSKLEVGSVQQAP